MLIDSKIALIGGSGLWFPKPEGKVRLFLRAPNTPWSQVYIMVKRSLLAASLVFAVSACDAGKNFAPVSSEVHRAVSRVDKQIKFKNTDDKEIACLAQNLYFEARNQSDDGMAAIGYVVKNRVKSSIWPDTMCEVIWQYRVVKGKKRPQFSWTIDGRSDVPKNKKEWERAKRIAEQVYWEEIENPVGTANHYYANYVSPSWAKNMRLVATVSSIPLNPDAFKLLKNEQIFRPI